MSVKIRLKRMGSKKRPFYRLVAADSRKPRDGRFLETLGYYNPVSTPAEVRVDEENRFRWIWPSTFDRISKSIDRVVAKSALMQRTVEGRVG